MSFKAHLIIVSVIIVVVYLVWGAIHNRPQPVAVQNPVKSPYSISITHASWGLNCPLMGNDVDVLDKAYAKKSAGKATKPYEDNVLPLISELCNGKESCSIAISPDTFGNLPPADCLEKMLEVEYRCFSFDRPWRVQASSGQMDINCAKKDK